MAGKLAVTQTASSDLVVDLKRLGFTEYEARVYVQLLRQSPATAYEISKSSNVPRPNTYHALDALAQRGAVLPVNENPVRYVPADPQELLETISRQTRSLCSTLADRLSSLTPARDDQYVWTLQGDEAVHDRIAALINDCRRTLWIKAADDVLRRHKEAIRAAAERGVETLIVLFGFDADEFRFTENCRVYIHEGNGVRMGTADNLFTLAVDHEEMLTAAFDKEVTAATTRSRPVVTMAGSLIRHDYYMAEIFARFGPQIDAEFGPYLRDLRLAYFSPEQQRSFMQRTGLDAVEPPSPAETAA
ncbi:TrmB family transcriptional regulator [Mangrovicella endophytica]|uniref:TrmB family transcriptional regulator n=1 Tax=Mangrovicella endophytica TaxID=2066697 RepID=UPI000C9E43D0|nr:TrmB family transcriptional regulator [Mangrovicella endophytica]